MLRGGLSRTSRHHNRIFFLAGIPPGLDPASVTAAAPRTPIDVSGLARLLVDGTREMTPAWDFILGSPSISWVTRRGGYVYCDLANALSQTNNHQYPLSDLAPTALETHLRIGFGSSLVKNSCTIACAAVILFIGSNSNSWVRSLYPCSEREREPYQVASWGLRLGVSEGRLAGGDGR